MGLANETAGHGKYVSVRDGMFTIRTTADDPNGVKRVNKEGKEVTELTFNKISGFLKGVAPHTFEHTGKKIKSWNITIEDAPEEFILTVPYSGAESRALLFRLPAIDLNDKVEFHVGKGTDKETGKEFKWMTVYQGGQKLEAYFTKQNPRDLPDLKKIKVKGEEQWDDSDRMEYFEKMVSEKFAKKEEPKKEEQKKYIDPIIGDHEDDLPF
jgi:hypothetical protein